VAWTGLKNSVDSLVGTTGEGIKAARFLTQAAQDLSQFTAGLNKEMQAQAKGAPSPGADETNRHLNRLVFGEDTNEGALDIIKRKFGWLAHPSEWFGGTPLTAPAGAPPAASTNGAAPLFLGRDVHSPQTGPYAYFPGAPKPAAQAEQAVSVSGQARVDHEITVRIEPSPLLTAIVDQARQQTDFTVPLIGGGTGRMDSDAAPHRGGIGHQ
jgi:hypothetical protein